MLVSSQETEFHGSMRRNAAVSVPPKARAGRSYATFGCDRSPSISIVQVINRASTHSIDQGSSAQL